MNTEIEEPYSLPNKEQLPKQPPYEQTHSHLGMAFIILGVLMLFWYTYRWMKTGGPYLQVALNGLVWVFMGNVLNWFFRIHRSLRKITGEKLPSEEEEEFK